MIQKNEISNTISIIRPEIMLQNNELYKKGFPILEQVLEV